MGKKGRKRLQTNPGTLKTAHLACLWRPCHAWVRAPTFDAVISCHNWPIKCLAFSGAEVNFRGRACVNPRYIFFVFIKRGRCLCWNINESERSIQVTEQSVNHHLREFNILQGNTNELDPAKKMKVGGGRREGRKETLADKALDFENLRSPANAAPDWLG